MKFDNCQMNLNANHGPQAPINFTSNSSPAALTSQISSEVSTPSAENILQFLKDLD